MQLPDEAISYYYQSLLVPTEEEWTPAAESRASHFLPLAEFKDLQPKLLQVRSQITAERELKLPPLDLQPLDSAFIDLPQKYLDQFRRQGEKSVLGAVLSKAAYLREQTDRVVVLGAGGEGLGGQAIIQALASTHHNDLPPETRLGAPRLYFAGDNVDSDALTELLEMLQTTCVDPELREERWAAIVVNKTGTTLETAAAYRAFRREGAEYYGLHSKRRQQLFIPVAGTASKLRNLCRADGYEEDDIFTIPDGVGSRYSVFSPAGLLPAGILGLDLRALLLGAAAMTRRFLDEPFERNPVLQFAAVNYLMTAHHKKPTRVMAIWSQKLEALGRWYEQIVGESLGKQGMGPTPLTAIQTRDLHTRGQQFLQGPRDKLITNLVVRAPRTQPIPIGMDDRNEDELNSYNRKNLPDLMEAAWRSLNAACFEVARPTADLLVPSLSEHVMGQLMQLLMLATVVEGRLLGINPYSDQGLAAYRHHMKALLRG